MCHTASKYYKQVDVDRNRMSMVQKYGALDGSLKVLKLTF